MTASECGLLFDFFLWALLWSYLPACFNSDAVRVVEGYRDFDRIVFLEIALYSMCTILDIVKLKRFKKGTDGFSTLRSNWIFSFFSYNGNPLLKFICKFEQLISFITVSTYIITMNLLYYEIPDLGRIPNSASSSFQKNFRRNPKLSGNGYLNICNLYCWVETWKGFLEFLFSLIGIFSMARSPERSFIERWRFPIKSWNSERLRVVASLVFGLRISTMWENIKNEFWD